MKRKALRCTLFTCIASGGAVPRGRKHNNVWTALKFKRPVTEAEALRRFKKACPGRENYHAIATEQHGPAVYALKAH